jgi:uroporphyrinogen decarboxylase
VWFSAKRDGRSLEYPAARGSGDILQAIHSPEFAAKLTMQPVERYDVNAAILLSGIVVPVRSVGFGIEIRPGTGPMVEDPLGR